MTFTNFCQVISDISYVPMDEIKETSSFQDHLAIDSLQMVNLLLEVSNRYGVELGAITPSEDIRTVGGMYNTFFKENVR